MQQYLQGRNARVQHHMIFGAEEKQKGWSPPPLPRPSSHNGGSYQHGEYPQDQPPPPTYNHTIIQSSNQYINTRIHQYKNTRIQGSKAHRQYKAYWWSQPPQEVVIATLPLYKISPRAANHIAPSVHIEPGEIFIRRQHGLRWVLGDKPVPRMVLKGHSLPQIPHVAIHPPEQNPPSRLI